MYYGEIAKYNTKQYNSSESFKVQGQIDLFSEGIFLKEKNLSKKAIGIWCHASQSVQA